MNSSAKLQEPKWGRILLKWLMVTFIVGASWNIYNGKDATELLIMVVLLKLEVMTHDL